MPLLATESLTKNFGQLTAVDDVSLTVEPGEFHSLIGPNGAGKTTFFDLITGGLSPSRGQIFFDEMDITGAEPHEIARIGCARSFQITSVFPALTVFENLRVMAQAQSSDRTDIFRQKASIGMAVERAHNLIDMLGLDEVRNRPAEELSHGQKRTLEVGLTLATDPELLLLDEPTAGMGREETVELINLLKQLKTEYTMFVVEHDMDVVMSLSDRITVLHDGSVIANGPPETVTENQAVNEAYLGEGVDV